MRADLIAKLQRIRRRLEEMKRIVERIDKAMPKFRRVRISEDVALKLERLSERVGIDPNQLATALITIELVRAKLELARR